MPQLFRFLPKIWNGAEKYGGINRARNQKRGVVETRRVERRGEGVKKRKTPSLPSLSRARARARALFNLQISPGTRQ